MILNVNAIASNKTIDAATRFASALFEQEGDFSATRLLRSPPPRFASTEPEEPEQRNQYVMDVVLSRMPVPDDNTPWEAILDFRSDPDACGQYRRMKLWMNSLARGNLPLNEIEDSLDDLLYQHEQYMKLHKLKFRHGVLRTAFTMPLESLKMFSS